MARTTLEAQFQDVSRRQIDAVCRAYVALQAARIDALAAADTVRRQEQSLGVLLNLPLVETARLEPQGALRTQFPPPPPAEDLAALALRCRPDLRAARLGIDRAGAEVTLQRANRFDDVFLFYDPITIQDNSPYGKESASSWAVGLTFALPIFNRNQGNIARAASRRARQAEDGRIHGRPDRCRRSAGSSQHGRGAVHPAVRHHLARCSGATRMGAGTSIEASEPPVLRDPVTATWQLGRARRCAPVPRARRRRSHRGS
jgi:hypothetical protein